MGLLDRMRGSVERGVTEREIQALGELRPDLEPFATESWCAEGHRHLSTAFLWGAEHMCVLVRCHPAYDCVLLPWSPGDPRTGLGAHGVPLAFRTSIARGERITFPAADTIRAVQQVAAVVPPGEFSAIRKGTSDSRIEALRAELAGMDVEFVLGTAQDPVIGSASIFVQFDEYAWASLGISQSGRWAYRTARKEPRSLPNLSIDIVGGFTAFTHVLAGLVESHIHEVTATPDGSVLAPGRPGWDPELFADRWQSGYWEIENISNRTYWQPWAYRGSRLAEEASERLYAANASVASMRDAAYAEHARLSIAAQELADAEYAEQLEAEELDWPPDPEPPAESRG